MKKSAMMMCLAVLLSFTTLFSGCAHTGAPETYLPAAPGTEITPEGETESVSDTQSPETEDESGILVAWFSATGTTKDIAQRLAGHLSADTFEFVPETPYTAADLDYTDSGSRTSIEQNDTSARPAISGTLPDIRKYDTVFIGYPIWHGQAPRIIGTFLEGCDFAKKTLIPFCTSGSSGIGSSADSLRQLTTDAIWAEGIRFDANVSDDELFAWADKIHPNGDNSGTLYIHVGDAVMSATLADNSSASALKELLADGDLTVSMHDYGNFEKVGALGSELPRNDESIVTEPGDVILYQGNQITIYYGNNTWELTRLGKILDVTAQELKDLLGDGDITITLSVSE